MNDFLKQLKITNRLLDIVNNDTVDPDFYHVVSTIALMTDQCSGDTGLSEGDIGMSITKDYIDIVDINDEDVQEQKNLLSLRLFDPWSLYRIRYYLQSYLITNKDVLNEEQIQELEELLEEVK